MITIGFYELEQSAGLYCMSVLFWLVRASYRLVVLVDMLGDIGYIV